MSAAPRAAPWAAGLLAVLVAAAGVWVLRVPVRLPASFGPENCRHVELVDGETGRRVVGVEDIALAPDGDVLILSALDRLDPARPQGELYAVSLPRLGAGQPVRARPLAKAHQGTFRPHGVALSPDGRRLAVVNHVTQGRGVVEVGPLWPGGWHPARRIGDPRFCRANDLVFTGDGGLLVTLDRADCRTSIRDLAGGTGRVALIRDGALTITRDGLDFPNGILPGWVAETRGARISGAGRAIALPGGPDNLSRAGQRIIAALRPNLVRTGLYITGWTAHAASRIVAIDPESGAVEVLYDDPGGVLFSGATVGILTDGRLVAGSVIDSGLLYCEAGT